MSNATIEQLNERYEQVTTEAKAALDKLNTAVRGAYTRLEENGNELFQTLVKTGEKRQKAQTKPQKKSQEAASWTKCVARWLPLWVCPAAMKLKP